VRVSKIKSDLENSDDNDDKDEEDEEAAADSADCDADDKAALQYNKRVKQTIDAIPAK
jgi:hypothetical protein